MRSFRVAWYACEKLGYVRHTDYTFGKDDELVSIPKGNTRKSFYLTVEQMTELYNCFLEKRYSEEWDVDWRENTHYSLDLFLVQYLGNGFNLADVDDVGIMEELKGLTPEQLKALIAMVRNL